jgi:class 3 adenylate cyclase/tetratricopeptide (TPR) repeat protein
MKCLHCEKDNPVTAKFCADCGGSLALACPACAHGNPPGSRFCNECGQSLGDATAASRPSEPAGPRAYTPRHIAERILISASALEGERKQVSVLFCDLVESTALAARLGPEAMHALLNRFFELALDEVHRYEGTINQFLGDGFMALFGAPLAHEDHARRAALAAIGIRRRLLERQAEFGLPEGARLSVRMGLHSGPVVVGKIGDDLRMDYTAVGDTTNLAARLQQVAEPGAILMSEATRRLTTADVRIEDVGPLHLKGRDEPVTAYRIAGRAPLLSSVEIRMERPASPFVGRERELADLRDLLEQVERGQGQIVGLVGEPGLGKSRLLFEFRRSLADSRVTYLEGRCLSYGHAISYLPMIEVLRGNCGIVEADDPAEIGEKLRFSLRELGMDSEERTAYLLALLGVKEGTEPLASLSAEAIRTRTFETIRQMTLRGSRRRPLVLAIEDLHWIDKTSQDLLVVLAETLAEAPLLLLTTYRPGYRPPWIERSNATQLALRPLRLHDSLSVVHSITQGTVLTDAATRIILDKAEGNPFFLEELTRAVAAHGPLPPTVAVPDTVQGVLMARIDRLADEPKRALQTAAVLGREFAVRLLEAIWEGPGVVTHALPELTRLEFLYERTGADEPAYVFKHALTQDVAYQSLLTTHRRRLHAAAGRALESFYADRIDAVCDRLAYHYSNTAESEKAIEYLIRSADKAAGHYAHAEAVAAMQQALTHVEGLPGEARDRARVDLNLRLVSSLYFLGRFPEIRDLLLSERERVEKLQDSRLAGLFHFRLAQVQTYLGDQEQSAQSAHLAIAEARRAGDQATMGKAYYVLTQVGYFSGRPHEGIEAGQRALSLLEATAERWWLGHASFILGFNYYLIGEFERALASEARCREIGEALGDPRLQSYADWVTAQILANTGQWDAAIDLAQRAVSLSPDSLGTAAAMNTLGMCYIEKGDPAPAIPILERAAGALAEFGFRQLHGVATIFLAQACLADGQVERAYELASRALEIALDPSFPWAVGWAQRLLGRIAHQRGSLEEADARLREALATFGGFDGRFEVGRTRLDLAALAHAQGDRDAAVGHLREARMLFEAVRVPTYVERTEAIAQQYGAGLWA